MLLSDNTSHDRYTDAQFLHVKISDHQQKNKGLGIYIFSDDCTGQFKCKYDFSNITLLKEQSNVSNLTRTFFATLHGKCVVDGIGAIVKQNVWNLVRARRVTLWDAETFFDACMCESSSCKQWKNQFREVRTE